MTATEKDFTPIQSDYEFFVAHATEAEADLKAYHESLEEIPFSFHAVSGPVRFLDFGCGPGTFTAQFLDRVNWPAAQVELALVEPVADYRQAAVTQLQARSAFPVLAWERLPENQAGTVDLALSNHAFYYVPALSEELARVVRALKPHGVFLAAIAGIDNPLIQIWIEAFAQLGRPVPYHTAETFEEALRNLQVPFHRKEVRYTLAFPDSEENREKILHFLLGEYLEQIPRATSLGFLDRYTFNQRIEINARHWQYVVRPTMNP